MPACLASLPTSPLLWLTWTSPDLHPPSAVNEANVDEYSGEILQKAQKAFFGGK